MPPSVRLRISHSPRDPARFPSEDDALGLRLWEQLGVALQRGLPRPVIAQVESSLVTWFDLVPALQLDEPHRGRMIAAMAGGQDAECAGLLGVLKLRAPRQERRFNAAVCYVEWPDNRWWNAWQPLDEARQPVGEGPVVRRAVDGWPRPHGVGGWFATCRRLHLKLTLTSLGGGGETVH